MKLLSFKAENFRNLEKLDLKLNQPVTAFTGANAQGKTNILEAISLLAFGKSLRTGTEKNLIKSGGNFFRLEGTAENSEKQKIHFELASNVKEKTLKINGRKKNSAEFVGNLPLVQFTPEDLNLLLLSPALRRRYLNILLSQVSREYLRASLSYSKSLKNRNVLLVRIAENLAKEVELEFWDTELAKHGTIIGKFRSEFLNFAEIPLAENFEKIANESKKLTIRLSGFKGEDITTGKYLENLKKLYQQDLRYGSTNYGPHRQDLIFELDGVSLVENGSRGEIRSSVLALKFTELKFLEERLGEKPILLLDDVFSELDKSRQKSLVNLVKDHQTFITTTKAEHLDPFENKDVWEVKDGKLEKA